MAGFTAHLLVPFFGDVQKTAFTQWLDQNVVASGNDTELKLRHSIRELPKNSSDFQALVKEASELVANHKEDFRIAPFTAEDDENQVTSWLIGQWSAFKHQQNSTNAILPEIIKPIQKWLTQTGISFQGVESSSDLRLPDADYNLVSSVFTDFKRILPPLVFGISINAP